MNKRAKSSFWLVTGVIVVASLYLYRTLELGRGDAQPAFLEPLNPGGELLGPEGICFDRQGNLLVADARGLVWNLGRGGKPEPFAFLSPGQKSGPPESAVAIGRTTGLAADRRGNIYAAFQGSAGSSLIQIDEDRNVKVIASDFGTAGALAVTDDDMSVWVADCRSEGRVLRYPITGPTPIRPNLVIPGLKHPAGLALGNNNRSLYIAEMYSGSLAEVDLTAEQPSIKRIADLKGGFSLGSLRSLGFDPRDPERRFLYAAEDLRGMITVVDVKSRPPRVFKHLRLTLMGGRLCTGGMIIRDGYLYCTDLWTCNPLRLALGFPKWQSHAYRFRVLDPAAFR